MRLLKLNAGGAFELAEASHGSVLDYAILSHTWGPDEDELTIDDIRNGTGKDKAGYAKLQFCGQQAKQDGLDYFWVDTCCIDKANLTELSKAINSMFDWYSHAQKCYVYLADVSAHKRDHHGQTQGLWEAAFQASRWHTRGWTLQEMLAPASVEFFSREGCLLGSKDSLASLIQSTTDIPAPVLRGKPLSTFSFQERMRWAEKRNTREIEDKWYSLLGIFGVSMVLNYGEKAKAEIRLKDEIAKSYRIQLDQTEHNGVKPNAGGSTISATDRRDKLLTSLGFEQMESRKSTIKGADSTTCQWLLNHSAYVAWVGPNELHQHHGFLWVKGKPGAGKSTLMKFAHAHADQKRSHDEILISFFFNARGDELEKSTTGMYRSLLLQILRKAPDLQHVLDDFDGFPGTHTQDPTWTLESLRKLFDTAIKGMKQRRLKCFIDALDECDEEQVREMIEFLEELGQHALEAGNEVYICFASRHYPTIDIRQGRELTLENEEGHSEDLAKYVQKHLRAGKGRYIEEVRGEICEKANGVFLWAVLVIDILNREFRHGRIFAVKKRLQEIPPKLSDLFKDILRRDLTNMNDLLLCLQWVLFAKRPLRREEFYFAMVAGLDSEPENISAWNTEQVTTDDMSQYVLNSSKGLAELTKSNTPTVQFIHESVRDFLLKDGGIYQLWPELGNDLCSKSHDRLKNCCQIYIHVNSSCCGSLYETLPKASSTAAKDLRTSLALRFPFLEYACQNVLYHADQAAATVPQHEFLRDLYFGALLKLKITFERYDVRRYTAGASLPYILAENGLAQLIRTARDNGAAFNVHGERYRLPLFAAIIHKHQHAIQVLLRQNEDTHEGLDIAYVDSVRDLVCREDSRKHKYLLWALQEKYESIAELVIRLTDDDRDLALKNSRGRSALSLAAELGYYRTVDLLLARGISIYSKDKSGRVPLPTVQGRVHRNGQGGGMDDALYYASSRGHEAIVRLLLEKGAGVAFVSSDFSNALDAASSRGYETVVRLLLLTGADVNDQGGPYGNALQAASLHGDENVVRLLLQNGADVNARGGPYGNALQAASYLGHETIARLILQNGAEVNAQGGRFGNAPQASSRGADEAVVRLLLDYRADVKVQGESPGTALQAARRGNGKDQEAIVRLLLKYGAIDTATDGSDVSVDR